MNIPQPPVRAHASVYRSALGLIIHSDAVYRSTGFDDQGFQVVLAEPVGDEEIGRLLRHALSSSRFLAIGEVRDFFDLKSTAPRYEKWLADMMAKLQVTSRRAFFRGLLTCHVEQMGGRVSITPMKRDGPEGWIGLGEPSAIITINASCTEVELGSACRLALGRCIG